jgi:hypothetical protein
MTACSATDSCANWLNVGPPTYLYSQLCVTAKANADALIGCFCMYCAGACTDQPTCTSLWETDQMLTQECSSCISAELMSTCLGYEETCAGG